MWIGIDIGSTTAKIVLMSDELELIDYNIFEVESDLINTVNSVLTIIRKYNIDGIGVTGSARKLIANCLSNKCVVNSEILAHTYGAQLYYKNIARIIEIGGQDSKHIKIDNGIISDFKMNSVCASGTGAFIAWQARRLGLSMTEFDKIAMQSQNILPLTGKCSVFIESSIVNLQRMGYDKADIAMAVCRTVVENYCKEFIKSSVFSGEVVFLGGVSRLESMRISFETVLKKSVVTHKYAQLMGAIGMARFAKDTYCMGNYDQRSVKKMCDFQSYNEFCDGCINKCIITRYKSNNVEFLVGGRCGKY